VTAEPDDDPFADRLAAWEESRLTAPDAELTPELRERLARGRDCVRRLRRWGARPAGGAPRRIGRFRIRRELGRGGFGVVFLAYDSRLRRRVALKVPRSDALVEAEFRERFQTEARAAAGLDHPNLVPVYESGQAGPVCYIVSAYCPGRTLRDWLRRRTEPVPFAAAAELVAALADGADHAHARGVVHRDLKPANVLLSRAGSRGPGADPTPVPGSRLPVPQITDVGLAKFADAADGPTRTGAVLGTPSYMAPEQAGGRAGAAGPRCDVYALGAILYELLTGRPPFVGDSDLDTLRQVTAADPVSPSRLRPQTPRDLETVCLKCLEKDPTRRYPSAAALAADLRRFLSGEPVKARPVGLPGRLWRRARRRPAVAALLAVIAALVVGGGAALVVSWGRTAAALGTEAAQRQKAEAELAAKLTILARIEWEAGRTEAASSYLRDCPARHRGPEWLYLVRMCRAEVATFPLQTGHGGRVAWSPDGRFVAGVSKGETVAGVSKGVVKVWDVATRAEAFAAKVEVTHFQFLGFSPDGRRLTHWTYKPKTYPYPVVMPPTDQPDKKPPRTYPWEYTTWDTATWERVRHAEFVRPYTGPFAISPIGPLYATVERERVRVEDVMTGRVVEFAHGHRSVANLGFDTGARHLFTTAPGEPIKLWSAATGTQVHAMANQPLPVGMYVADRENVSPDGRRFVHWKPLGAEKGMQVMVRDVESDCELASYAIKSFTNVVRVSPDGRYLAVAEGAVVRVWDLADRREVLVLRGHAKSVLDGSFSPDGRRLASISQDNTVRVWDVAVADAP
jgi:hypothetical protein